MGHHRNRAVAAATLAALVLSGCGSESSSDPVIRLGDSYSPAHPFGKYGTATFNEAAQEAGFQVDYFPAGQMGNPQDLATLVGAGVLTIAPASAAYLEDQFPLASVSDLPNMTTDACVAANAMMDLLSEGGILYEEEYEPMGMRPLWISIIPNYEILTASRQVTTPEDLRGLIIRSSGGAFDVTMAATGAAAVSMPAGDTYEAMSRNTVDGTVMPFLSTVPYRLDEVSAYSTDGLNLGSVGIPYVMSHEAWDALTAEQQSSIQAAADEANQTLCEALNTLHEEGRTFLQDNGVTMTEVDLSPGSAWGQLTEPVPQRWAESLDDIGLPGSEVLSRYEAAIARHEGAQR